MKNETKKQIVRVALEQPVIEKINELRSDYLLALEIKSPKHFANQILLLVLSKVNSYEDLLKVKRMLYNGEKEIDNFQSQVVPKQNTSEVVATEPQTIQPSDDDGIYEEDLDL